MKPVVIYHSTYGNTEHIALTITEALNTICGCTAQHITDASNIPDGTDLLIIGAPTKQHGVDQTMKDYLERLGGSLEPGMNVAAFDTRLQVPALISGSAARVIARKLTKMGGQLVMEPESFYVEGHDGPLCDGELERAAGWGRQVAASVMLHA